MIQFCSRFVTPRIRIVRVPKGRRGTIVSAGLIANLIREGEPPEFADCGNGYSAAPLAGCGYYAEPPDYGYYGERPEMGEYEPPVGYYAEEQPLGGYSQAPEMVGYEPLSESPESTGYYAEPDVSGYVRKTAEQPFNPGCPMPTNVAGFAEAEPYAEAEPFAGYQRPRTVNPSCGQFTPQPGVTESSPETFKPLW